MYPAPFLNKNILYYKRAYNIATFHTEKLNLGLKTASSGLELYTVYLLAAANSCITRRFTHCPGFGKQRFDITRYQSLPRSHSAF